MISLFVLLITLQSAHRTLVTSKPPVPVRYLISRRVEPQQNVPITCDAKTRLADFAIAVQIAMQSLNKETYLDQDVPKTKLPPSVESISILDDQGKVKDSTLSDFIDKTYPVPSSGQTKEGEYYIQLKSTLGIRWILIKTKTQ
ncbi:MAG TPA: hypothetical protein VIX17_03265 [Pyrinomonadaceae bacterium]